MRYPWLLAYNAAGAVCWATGFVLLGYLAGNSYPAVERAVAAPSPASKDRPPRA